MTLIEKAQDFAHRAHDVIEQKRKYSGEPYWVHTDEVAQIGWDALKLQNIGDEYIQAIVAGYHMHDYREDVVTKLEQDLRLEVLAKFEDEYASFPLLTQQIVTELTDVFVKEAYPQMNRAERKHNERERIGKTSDAAKTGKLADLISNTRSIVEHDKDFARTYLREKFALLPYLADGSPKLLQEASMQTIAGFTQLGLTIPTIR